MTCVCVIIFCIFYLLSLKYGAFVVPYIVIVLHILFAYSHDEDTVSIMLYGNVVRNTCDNIIFAAVYNDVYEREIFGSLMIIYFYGV